MIEEEIDIITIEIDIDIEINIEMMIIIQGINLEKPDQKNLMYVTIVVNSVTGPMNAMYLKKTSKLYIFI